MNIIQRIQEIKLRIIKKENLLPILIYLFFVFSFIFYAVGDMLTSGQTYHHQADRKLSYISLGFLVFSIGLGVVTLLIKAICNKSLKQLLSKINPLIPISIASVVLIETLSALVNGASFSSLFQVVLYPIIFFFLYIFFIEIDFFISDKRLMFVSFLLFFTLYSIFFIFYFFYIQGKPTSGGGLRIPTIAHVFFLLSIFCYLRRFLNEQNKIVLYCLFLPLVLLSGKMSVTIILLVILISDLSDSLFFEIHKKAMIIVFASLLLAASIIIVISNVTKDNFLADNFSFYSLIYSGRIENWYNLIPNIKSFTVKEWLLGKGPSATLSYNKGTAAHNDFIEYLFDYGVLGLIAFLGLIASLLVQYFKQKKI